jgi:hypothetical protein
MPDVTKLIFQHVTFWAGVLANLSDANLWTPLLPDFPKRFPAWNWEGNGSFRPKKFIVGSWK